MGSLMDEQPEYKLKFIPVVDSFKNMNLLFMVRVSELKTYCEEFYGDLEDQENSNKAVDLNDSVDINFAKEFMIRTQCMNRVQIIHKHLVQLTDYSQDLDTFW